MAAYVNENVLRQCPNIKEYDQTMWPVCISLLGQEVDFFALFMPELDFHSTLTTTCL